MNHKKRDMINMDKLPYVKVDFAIEGKNFNLNRLTEELEIVPTETRNIDDWPEAIKNNSNLPEELQPGYSWCISQEMDLCTQIEIPINRLIDILKGREQKLLEFCKRNNLSKCLCITIQAESIQLPGIVLSPHIVSYFGKLEAEIGFDIYTY